MPLINQKKDTERVKQYMININNTIFSGFEYFMSLRDTKNLKTKALINPTAILVCQLIYYIFIQTRMIWIRSWSIYD